MVEVSEKVEKVGNSTNSTNSTKTTKTTNPGGKPGKQTYAQAVQNQQNPQKTTTPTSKQPKRIQPTKKEEKENLHKRKLVLFTSKEHTISPLGTRNQINTSFKEKLWVSKPVLCTITKSLRKQNIILTTSREYNSDFLLQHKDIWANFVQFSET